MLNIIENKFGKDVKIIYGDWCIKTNEKFYINTKFRCKKKIKREI